MQKPNTKRKDRNKTENSDKFFKFQKLIVWHKAVDYTVLVMAIADSLPQKYQFSFGEQLRRATLSITNNIAEGTGRNSKKEAKNFFNFSKASVYETINILIILHKTRAHIIRPQQKEEISSKADELCRMLSGLIRKQH